MHKSKITFRTAETLPQFLESKLKLYSVAAGAAGVSLLALTQSGQAQIVYTSVHSYIPSQYNFSNLDMNHDGIPDFRFSNAFRSFPYAASDDLEVGGVTGGVLALSGGSASALTKGAMIGPSGRFGKGYCLMAGTSFFNDFQSTYYFHIFFGPWNDVENRYLGVSFSIRGETHYGWIRMSVNTQVFRKIRALVTGYAYESTANTPIRAGQTSGNWDGDDQTEAMLQPDARSGASLGMLAGGAAYRHNAIRKYDVCRTQPN